MSWLTANKSTDKDGDRRPSVSWAYQSPNSPKARCRALYRPSKLHSFIALDQPLDSDSNLELNRNLVGLNAACDVLSVYETNSGFYYKFGVSDTQEESITGADISRHIDPEDILRSKRRWDESVQDLTGTFVEDDVSSSNDSSSLASYAVFDSIEWRSADYRSMPATPKPNAAAFSHGVSRSSNLSPSWVSPSSKLSASASSFTPSKFSVPSLTFSDASPSTTATQSSPSPPLYDFEFPSLNASIPKRTSYPKLKIAKDDQGFFTNVETELEEATPKSRLHSSTLLPAFLQDEQPRRKGSASKTRVLVDRLRSKRSSASSSDSTSPSPVDPILGDDESATSFSRSPRSTPPPVYFSSDNDGWIGVEQPSNRVLQSKKRDLVLPLSAPRHHREESGPVAIETDEQIASASSSPSSSSSAIASHSSGEGWQELGSLSSSSTSSGFPSMPPTPPLVTDNDGWIEVASPSNKSSTSHHDANANNRKDSSVTRAKKKLINMSGGALTFPTLNSPPPNPQSARSHSRTPSTPSSGPSRTQSSSASKSAGRPKQPAHVASASFYGPYRPMPAVPIHMPYPPYAMMPVPMPMPVPVPVPVAPQYHSQPHPHHYAYPSRPPGPQQHTHPHPGYPSVYNNQRAHSVAVPVPPAMPMPSGYMPKVPFVATPPGMRPGLW